MLTYRGIVVDDRLIELMTLDAVAEATRPKASTAEERRSAEIKLGLYYRVRDHLSAQIDAVYDEAVACAREHLAAEGGTCE